MLDQQPGLCGVLEPATCARLLRPPTSILAWYQRTPNGARFFLRCDSLVAVDRRGLRGGMGDGQWNGNLGTKEVRHAVEFRLWSIAGGRDGGKEKGEDEGERLLVLSPTIFRQCSTRSLQYHTQADPREVSKNTNIRKRCLRSDLKLLAALEL